MANKTIKKDQIKALLNKIAQSTQLIAPIQSDGITLFKPVQSGEGVMLDYQNAVVPPKDFFFPQSEKMFSYDTSDPSWAIKNEEGIAKRVLFGSRPCDGKSLILLDKVFDAEFRDDYYIDKREKTTVVGLSCTECRHTCFCQAFGISPGSSDGSDILMTNLGDKYLVEVITDKGTELVKACSDLFADDDGSGVAAKEKAIAPAKDKQLKLDLEGIKAKLDNMFDSTIWDSESLRCIGCGTCTFICPTCHCFDIVDFNNEGSVGYRYRCADSCQFANFTRAAGGHQPRPTKKERTRQRFMHKLRYFVDRYGEAGCVGCGRCLEKCPVNLDIAQIINKVKEVG
jgi:sulfhydrogenase subunit beta (sulfur reductase)